MLTFEHVTFQYAEDPAPIISDLSFHVTPESFVSIIGASGCGKTTIFRLINKLMPIESGRILVSGQDISQMKSDVGYMPQKDLLFPWRTIEKNLWLPMELKKLSKKEMARRSAAILEEIGLSDYKDKYPKDLSGGMRQRISFARTLLTDADLMLLDEPFSALDSLTKMSMQEWLLGEWERHHKTILFITHDVEEAIFLSDTIFVIKEKPITALEIIKVPLPYPRNRQQLKDPRILDLKESLISQLKAQVMLS